MSDNIEILIVGAGPIAREYIKVLDAMNCAPIVVGRGESNLQKVKEAYPRCKVFGGGINGWLSDNKPPPNAIIATPVEHLASNTKELLISGCRNILVEKPLTFNKSEALELANLAKLKEANVFIAFNRRSYVSVMHAKELIEIDGGVSSYHFDFSEAIFTINPENYSEQTVQYWGMANSSHVIDTAFHLGGNPETLQCGQYGNDVSWHKSGSIFTGMGEAPGKVPFTYHANWGCPGRWNIAIMTSKRKLLLSPMEQLHQQLSGGFAIELVDLDYSKDLDFKPGFYHQVEVFLKNNGTFHIDDLSDEIELLNRILNY
ncbi:MAG: Gfo/Idh/MocA family oxidoreductase [Cyclobacteriaceae bacterium]